MNEAEIARTKVIPYLEQKGWSKQLITEYGRVPIKMGVDVKYADILAFFVDANDNAFPYLIVEVKTSLLPVEEIEAQALSYSKQLDTQVFAITDGEEYRIYQRTPWGNYIQIKDIPVPEKQFLTVSEKTQFHPFPFVMVAEPTTPTSMPKAYPELEPKIDNFFKLIIERFDLRGEGNYTLKSDISWHYSSIKTINAMIQNIDIDNLEPEEFKNIFSNFIMCKLPNRNKIFEVADHDFPKIQAFLKFLKDFIGTPEENLARLFSINDELHINGAGPFIISQFLAGSFPRDYAIVEDNMVVTMKNLKLIDVRVHSDTPKGYLYINDMCKKLLVNVFAKKIEEYKPKMPFTIDEDFSMVVMHEFFWEFNGFHGYDLSQLTELTEDEKAQNQEIVDSNLETLDIFFKEPEEEN